MNRCQLLGNLGRNAELKYAANGTPICSFSLATSEKRGEEWVSTWHKVIVFGRVAEEMAPRLLKGCQAFIDGKIQNREYEGKDGVKKHVSEVIAFTVKLIDRGERVETPANHVPDFSESRFKDEDIPF